MVSAITEYRIGRLRKLSALIIVISPYRFGWVQLQKQGKKYHLSLKSDVICNVDFLMPSQKLNLFLKEKCKNPDFWAEAVSS